MFLGLEEIIIFVSTPLGTRKIMAVPLKQLSSRAMYTARLKNGPYVAAVSTQPRVHSLVHQFSTANIPSFTTNISLRLHGPEGCNDVSKKNRYILHFKNTVIG